MSHVTLKGNKVTLEGKFLTPPQLAPDFVLVNKDLENVTLRNYRGKIKLLATIPSVDTPVCNEESRTLHKLTFAHPEVAFLVISKDLPFAQDRFCGEAKLPNLHFLSDLRPTSLFGRDYGVLIADGPLAGLLTRSLIVLNKDDKVIYSQLVSEISSPPDFTELFTYLK